MKKKKISFKDKELSDDCLYESYEQTDEKKRIQLLKKSLHFNPDNIDALLSLNHMSDDPYDRLSALSRIIPHAYALMEEEGFFEEEYIGHFWGFHETRPFMRAKHDLILNLMSVGFYYQAIAECMELLTLCENDNQGIRYILMELYAITLHMEGANQLRDDFDEVTFQFVFPYAIMLYRLDMFEEAKKVFEELFEVYPFAKGIIKFNKEPDEKTMESLLLGVPLYKPGEVHYTLMEMDHLVTPDFLKWFKKEFTVKRQKKS